MFKKVLIANRGEIAVRVNRAAHELGIATVAIFSEPDRASLHVRNADESFCVGPGAAARSYLNIPNIISAALISGADAVHPGYGFLAENARFAEICADHGLCFVGPAPETIAQMGDKATAKAIMRDAKVPTTPGSDILASVSDAFVAARAVGYPVMLKATAGGGGKGMRAVNVPDDLESAFMVAQAEAEANFKDGRLYLEKLLEQPRHIEVQVLGDTFGNVVHVGERDCSVQKPSHQKLVEEAPAPVLGDALRTKLHRIAVAAARAVGYRSAGTLEFLVSGDDAFFMEMNTRIQVEHSVTEMVYGVDLVREQLRIAAGEKLELAQRDLVARGHAIECRINAEGADFTPAAGTLGDVALPGGFGVRVDSHAYAGLVVSPFYDALLAKIIAHGRTRDEAIERMSAALADTHLGGVKTTVATCAAVMRDERFRAGGVAIDFLPALGTAAAASA
ncbi:MAG: acetyl-CoA carboxylase biotin carboxylase subunit [Candidatus Eremiobacteraeota bacterium]|nr:acetyl-CoA carboxylase biotin carboxylase subunit [Candidatus Eremiobacteraeota bacterium]MBC5802004.1 acetyl-CoA carboxylase biotin carboxylase subunit [Candidatus Eremiobacteraeota bacterium]MBC5820394.1 acetyl-CoA carboxylase biotin carboxylase subunit [Candidatus Eremiobacteraeota bacterium]